MFLHLSHLKSTCNKTGLGAITAAALGHEINLSHVLAEVCPPSVDPFTEVVAPSFFHS